VKRNILIIIADQLSQKAVGAYGNPYSQTPAIDSIAAEGVRFANAYTPCPLCQPARAAFWTGNLPHTTGILSNGRKHPVPPLPDDIPTLGDIFQAAGYETVHFGKRHDAGSLRGFDCAPIEEKEVAAIPGWPLNQDTYRDVRTTEQAVAYLKQSHETPFVMIADLINPHNICGYVGENIGPHEDIPVPGELPPLPDNFEFTDLDKRPQAVQYICCSHRRLAQAAQWSELNYRHYLAAYYHYVNRVDQQIGQILEALDNSDAADSTLIVFFSDHGDSMAAHRMVTKQVSFYEETTRVPFIFAGCGVSEKDRVASEPLVSLSDLLPTLCEYAALPAPEGIYGESLMPFLHNHHPPRWREGVVSEWHTEWGFTISPGRMVRTARYKYTRYLENGDEALYDLVADPGETRTLINASAATTAAAYAHQLSHHRDLLREHIAQSEDPFLHYEVKADPRWRSHPLGYPNHRGPSAPEV
jgi:choline-sulfatase